MKKNNIYVQKKDFYRHFNINNFYFKDGDKYKHIQGYHDISKEKIYINDNGIYKIVKRKNVFVENDNEEYNPLENTIYRYFKRRDFFVQVKNIYKPV